MPDRFAAIMPAGRGREEKPVEGEELPESFLLYTQAEYAVSVEFTLEQMAWAKAAHRQAPRVRTPPLTPAPGFKSTTPPPPRKRHG